MLRISEPIRRCLPSCRIMPIWDFSLSSVLVYRGYPDHDRAGFSCNDGHYVDYVCQRWIDYQLGVALVLGENIGTTITANLAALTGNTQARRAALAHLAFNIFGVIWVLILFYPFTNAVSWFVTNVMRISDPSVAVSFKLAAFHTAFNISNTFCYDLVCRVDREDGLLPYQRKERMRMRNIVYVILRGDAVDCRTFDLAST